MPRQNVSPGLRSFLIQFGVLWRDDFYDLEPLLGPLISKTYWSMHYWAIGLSIFEKLYYYDPWEEEPQIDRTPCPYPIKVKPAFADSMSEVLANSPLHELLFLCPESMILGFPKHITTETKIEAQAILKVGYICHNPVWLDSPLVTGPRMPSKYKFPSKVMLGQRLHCLAADPSDYRPIPFDI